jgi:histidine triad (HIT) family protein
MEECIFCKIAAGDIPCTKVYEDDVVLAFEDANPLMPVHTLVIPKAHYGNIGDGVPDDVMAHVFQTVSKVAEIQGIARSGYRVMVNTGDDACQSVHHLHVHVLGGGKMNEDSPAAV